MKKRIFMLITAALVMVFSFVLIACDSDTKDDPLTLTLTNYPSDLAPGQMIGASLLADSVTDPVPVAVGGMPVVDGTTATYTFYHPSSGSEMPDMTRPFTDAGSYFPAVAEVSLTNPTGSRTVHDFNGDKLVFSSSTPNHTVDFVSDFTVRTDN